MKTVLDLHIHSRFSRACSKDLTLPTIAKWCERKGIDVVGTGDFTHPAWRAEIERDLEPAEPGLFRLKSSLRGSENDRGNPVGIASSSRPRDDVRFMLTNELSCIYKRGGKVRRVHHCVFVPSHAAADAITSNLEKRGCNVKSDGRPILGLDSEELLKIVLDADPSSLMVPAHAWTPWFAIFGSQSGFDSIEECFGDLAPEIHAIETGLSSDPSMNWRLSALDRVMLLSNSDAHSAPNLGREANVMDLPERSYPAFADVLRKHQRERFLYTIEFFPEEGKYHYDGHRVCGVRLTPAETKKNHGLCPSCKKSVTVGVMHRVDALADRPDGFRPPGAPDYRRLVPLMEVVADALGKTKAAKLVGEMTEHLVEKVGSEFHILLDAPIKEIEAHSSPEVAEAIRRMREGKITVLPGYDGVYGTVQIFTDEERKGMKPRQNKLVWSPRL